MDLILEKSMVLKRLNVGKYMEYRIPGICVSARGTILFCCESRSETGNDWATIDIAVSRSADGGNTWQERILTRTEAGEEVTWNNPTWIVDGETIHLLYCRNYEKAYHIMSVDDGVSWSEPNEITDVLKKFAWEWNVCAIGPGHGIAARDGRIYAAVWLANGECDSRDSRKKAHHPSVSGVIFSKDHGKTWETGDLARGLTDGNETCIAETHDGNVLLNIRHCGQPMCRALTVYSKSEGKCIPVRFSEDLPDPMCFGSMVNLSDGTILCSNCASDLEGADLYALPPKSHARTDLCIHASVDDGRTWRKIQAVDAIGGYSDLAAYRNHVYILYEQTINGKIQNMICRQYGIVAESAGQ